MIACIVGIVRIRVVIMSHQLHPQIPSHLVILQNTHHYLNKNVVKITRPAADQPLRYLTLV
mgnify:FL=1